jgi:methylated-DNA-[protein]-cysteine S-methyltransferase
MSEILYTAHYESPFGQMITVVNEEYIVVRLVFPNEHDAWQAEIHQHRLNTVEDASRNDFVLSQLDEYFAKKRTTFDLPLKLIGTDFQKQVWRALQTIPYGVTISYKQLAELIGNPAAVRAVGRANGSNRIPIIIPCHRVIGADGSLTGFGGGLALKVQLLQLEGIQVAHTEHQAEQLALL